MNKKQKKGISLIILVITIVVVIILSGTVILTISQNNSIYSARKASFLKTIAEYNFEITLWITNEYTNTLGKIDTSTVNATKDSGTYMKDGNVLKIKDIIINISTSNENKFKIVSGKLQYIGEDENEKLWFGVPTEEKKEEEEALKFVVPAAPESVNPIEEGYIFDIATKTITGYNGTKKDIVIPKSFLIDGITYDVLNIGNNAFNNKQLTSLVISNNITTIGNEAFKNNSTLTSLVIDAPNLKTISNAYWYPPFCGCNLTNKITITSNATNIGDALFKDAGITEITIPNSVKTIEHNAFRNNSLTAIKIPSSVTSIGNSAFDTNKITSVSIPSTVTNIGEYVFSSNLVTSFEIPTYMTTIPRGFLAYNKLTSLTIPSYVTNIGNEAFRNNSTLTSLVIDAPNLKTLSNAYWYPPFCGCNLTNKITITSNATNIGDALFKDAGITEITIPNSVKTIEHNAFRNNNLTAINIPSTVTSIGNSAFDTNKITSVSIPSTVTNIGEYVFSSNLVTSFEIPTYMTTIPTGFLAYNKLTSLTIPSYVTNIGNEAFRNNSTLTSLVIDATNLKTLSNAYWYPPFCGCNLTNKITITSNATNIGDALFKDAGITEITIPNSVKIIEHNAFRNNNLTAINIPSSVTSIGNSAFDTNKITSVSIPSTVTNIGVYAFASNLVTLFEVPTYMTAIPAGFLAYNKLTSLTIPSYVTNIGNEAFKNNPTLTSLVIDATNLRTVDGAYWYPPFCGCNLTNKITITSNATNIGDALFKDAGITEITIPNSIKTIEHNAFRNNNLTAINIPSSVTSIGNSAFDTNKIPQGSAIIKNSEGSVAIGQYAFSSNGPNGNVVITPVYQP